MYTIQSTLLHNCPDIRYAFTTRHNGVSKQPYNSNNIAFHVGDNEKNVLLNHAALAKTIGYDPDSLVHMRQIHSDKVVIVDKTFTFGNPPECDALITNIANKPLMVMTADCTPVLLYDPRQKVVAAIHAGRAGAFKNIVAKSIHAMREHFHSRPSDILGVLGPSIGVCCYEVDKAISDEASGLGLEYAMENRSGRSFLDVNAILVQQLLKEGVLPEHIEQVGQCSSCKNDLFFSYRADRKRTGRMGGVILIKS